MGYLKEFLTQIHNRDFHKFLVLWEEYCTSDTVDFEEFSQLLRVIKDSDWAAQFGQIAETAIPLWKLIDNKEEAYEILRLIFDLQTTNSALLMELALSALKQKYENDPKFNDRIRLANLRSRENFQGALSRYDLVAHMQKNNIVFHTGGWGTGEIIDVSFVREHLIIEFENIGGRKDLSFVNAFKTLIPLDKKHFLARRFADADALEKEGKEDPVGLIRLLLHDVGPKTAGEIKDELCELVIPEKEWTKWWQVTRSKIKKHPLIESPSSLKEPFYLRKAELAAEDRLHQSMQNKTDIASIIQTTYNFVRDNPAALKNPSTKNSLQEKLIGLLTLPEITREHVLQAHFLLEQFLGDTTSQDKITAFIQSEKNIEDIVQAIPIVAFKKKALLVIKEERSDWADIFLNLLFVLPQSQLCDYLLKELNQNNATRESLEKKLETLLAHPIQYPDMFVWYFQKLMGKTDKNIPFQNQEGKNQFFEGLFILMSGLENQPHYRELLKKIYGLISAKRYALVREFLEGSSIEFAKEFLLLASKCQTLTAHDLKILQSLAEVVHPSLASKRSKGKQEESDEIWTTEEGYLKIQERIRQIGTVETVENAREIEAARALGDLRENSEFKFAQEKRARLQSELKELSTQLNKARVITPEDVPSHEVGVGSVVDVLDAKGNRVQYTILGPWDAEPERYILSFNSKLAQAMMGKKMGDQFQFRDETFKIVGLSSYFK